MKQYSLQKDKEGNHTLLFRGEDGFGNLPNNQEQMDYAVKTLKGLKVNPEYIGWLHMFNKFAQENETIQLSIFDL